jgi:hypothetical protein
MYTVSATDMEKTYYIDTSGLYCKYISTIVMNDTCITNASKLLVIVVNHDHKHDAIIWSITY